MQEGQLKKKTQDIKNEKDLEIGPNPRKMQKLQYHDLILDNLPSADHYQLSYMHRDIINNILTSNIQNIIITVSIDGHIKFWKKVFNLVEFIKNFKAHNGLITSTVFNKNHDLLASTGIDKTIKIFDILNCDLRTVVKLNFSPFDCQFIPQHQYNWDLLAISEEKTGKIMIVDPYYTEKKTEVEDDNEVMIGVNNQNESQEQKQKKQDQPQSNIIETLTFHKTPVKAIKMNWKYQVCFSIDERSMLQIWDPYTFDFPKKFKYSCKIEAEYLKLLSANSIPISLCLSPKGTYIAIILKDRSIRLFNIITGKNVCNIFEPLSSIIQIQQSSSNVLHLQQNQYQRKMILEKDIETSKEILFNPNCIFDQTQQFLIYTSFHGLKFYSIETKNVERIIATKEHQRFTRLAIFQGQPMRNPAGSSNAKGQRKASDPTIYCTAFKRPRFYIFSRRQPDFSDTGYVRDVINQRPNKEQVMIQKLKQESTRQRQVILHTSMGDITIQLFVDDCPKACQNFLKLSKKGYYNGLIFHRVIKGFMIQSGCPKGDGTGGQSIWGKYFADELCTETHRFDKPYVLAMANRGPNTNGSQFFITVVPCPWLDNKHTVFGRVIKGVSQVIQINKQKTDRTQKPLMPIYVTSTRVIKAGGE